MFDNNSYRQPTYGYDATSLATKVSAVMKRVYFKMTLGLLVSAFIAMWCSDSQVYWSFMQAHSWAIWVLLIAEIGLVIAISGAIRRLSAAAASGLFYLFAAVNGLALAPIFIVYTSHSIAVTFFVTAGTFAAMSIYGYFTSNDLSKMGSILFMALIGLVIASVVNFFLHSETMMWIITYAGVLIFVGLTAWDTQQIKNMAIQMDGASTGKLATIGALTLYLDFINLFLYLLRIFGNRD
ncbi:MAG: Bax inhibitor-1/YccA family protein [Muribaculaceae bacterium]|nr:Bax inhibitor-1/YccA family protein [Muribaculaceae bacterium]